jgi:hypothetical protein
MLAARAWFQVLSDALLCGSARGSSVPSSFPSYILLVDTYGQTAQRSDVLKAACATVAARARGATWRCFVATGSNTNGLLAWKCRHSALPRRAKSTTVGIERKITASCHTYVHGRSDKPRPGSGEHSPHSSSETSAEATLHVQQ